MDGSSMAQPHSGWQLLSSPSQKSSALKLEQAGQASGQSSGTVITRNAWRKSLCVCMDSWAILRGLVFWLPMWAAQDWQTKYWPLWGADPWQDLGKCEQSTDHVVYHVSGHMPLLSSGNDLVDALTRPTMVDCCIWHATGNWSPPMGCS